MANEQCSIFDFVDDDYIYKINKPIRLIEFFAGVGAQHKALTNIKANFESYKICEWALPSIIGYNAIHLGNFNGVWDNETDKNKIAQFLYDKGVSLNYNEPATLEQLKRVDIERLRQCANSIVNLHNLVDISRVKGDTLEVVDKDKYTYMLTYSYPCITEDSLILTKDGYKQYKDLQVGEYVLTKSNTWQKIAKKFDNGIHKTYYLQGMGFENIHCTANHKFYVREKYREGHKGIRKFKEPEFKQVKDITKNDYFGIPVIKEEIPFFTEDLDFWWLIGYYLGDGWLTKGCNEIKLACNETKLLKLKEHIDRMLKNLYSNKYQYTYYKERTCYKLRFCNKEIYDFILKNIGTGCYDKSLSGNILMMPKKQLNALLEGYIDSDGSRVKNHIQFTSVNRKLIYSISCIINKVYNRPTCIYKTEVSPKKLIEDRLVNQKPQYMLRFKPTTDIQDKAFYEDGYIWYPFTKIVEDKEEHVYNMEIENDHSYIVQGCISANCQDLSSAGKQMGQVEGSGTRSSLLWEVGRILKECKETDSLPQVLLMENVPNCHGTKNIKEWHKWLETLEQLGYKNFWKDLNSKDYEIPQTRNRCYMVSILKESDKPIVYNFPKKKKLKLLLKDLLESNVDEKYYLSEQMLKGMASTKFQSYSLKHSLQDTKGVCSTLIARYEGNPLTILDQNKNVVVIPENTKKGYALAKDGDGVYINRPEQKRGTVQKGMIQTLKTSVDDIGVVVKGNYMPSKHNASRIISVEGIAPTVMENHGTITAIEEPSYLGTYQYSNSDKFMKNRERYKPNKECADTLQTTQKEEVVTANLIRVGGIFDNNNIKRQSGSIYNSEGLSPSLSTAQGGYATPMVVITENTENGVESTPVLLGGLGNKCNNDTQYHTQNRIYDDKMDVAVNTGFNPYYYSNLKIRKLTPLECFRLMAFSDEDYYKMKQYLSDSKLYHCMGDSIVVKVLEYIFKELF